MRTVLPAAAGEFGTTGLAAFISDNVVTILFLVVGAAALWAATKGKISKVVTVAVCAVVAAMVLALAVNNGEAGKALGEWAVGLFREQS
ncbi:MAG: hypothetical protein FWH11_14335 [Micrococcales bacterium]|nr:hypothetical protein [Micrococcales bacterium]